MPIACLLVAAGGRLSEMPPIRLPEARRLASSYRDEPIVERRAAEKLAERIRTGEIFVWGFPSLEDAHRIAVRAHPDERIAGTGTQVDVVIANVAEPTFIDRCFVSPGAGSMAARQPDPPALVTGIEK